MSTTKKATGGDHNQTEPAPTIYTRRPMYPTSNMSEEISSYSDEEDLQVDNTDTDKSSEKAIESQVENTFMRETPQKTYKPFLEARSSRIVPPKAVKTNIKYKQDEEDEEEEEEEEEEGNDEEDESDEYREDDEYSIKKKEVIKPRSHLKPQDDEYDDDDDEEEENVPVKNLEDTEEDDSDDDLEEAEEQDDTEELDESDTLEENDSQIKVESTKNETSAKPNDNKNETLSGRSFLGNEEDIDLLPVYQKTYDNGARQYKILLNVPPNKSAECGGMNSCGNCQGAGCNCCNCCSCCCNGCVPGSAGCTASCNKMYYGHGAMNISNGYSNYGYNGYNHTRFPQYYYPSYNQGYNSSNGYFYNASRLGPMRMPSPYYNNSRMYANNYMRTGQQYGNPMYYPYSSQRMYQNNSNNYRYMHVPRPVPIMTRPMGPQFNRTYGGYRGYGVSGYNRTVMPYPRMVPPYGQQFYNYSSYQNMFRPTYMRPQPYISPQQKYVITASDKIGCAQPCQTIGTCGQPCQPLHIYVYHMFANTSDMFNSYKETECYKTYIDRLKQLQTTAIAPVDSSFYHQPLLYLNDVFYGTSGNINPTLLRDIQFQGGMTNSANYKTFNLNYQHGASPDRNVYNCKLVYVKK